MYINFGKLKGKKLLYNVPQSVLNNVRPTSGAVKSVLFNLLMHNSILTDLVRIDGSRVADFCCGTGSIGFEFISLGAQSCTFFDQYHENVESIESNAKRLAISDKVSIRSVDLLNEKYSKRLVIGEFDIIFIDPPYNETEKILSNVFSLIKENKILSRNGILVVESNNAALITGNQDFEVILQRKARKDRNLTFLRIK